MILESIRREKFAHEIGLVSDNGEISKRGLADLLRSPLSRWGLSPRSAVLRYTRDQLDAAGLRDRASALVLDVLQRLLRLGECADLRVGHERYIAPAPARWIRTGEQSAALLGVGPAPEGIVEHGPDASGDDIVRRVQVQNDDDLAALRMAGVRETSIDEWLMPFGYLDHARRRAGHLIRSDGLTPSQFWELLVSRVADHGLLLGDDAEIRSVVGASGGYFGQYNSDSSEGRWSDVAPDGVWCAYRRGYGPQHWQPIILAVEEGRRHAMDLYDGDEWRWALIARGCHTGADERVERRGDRIGVGFPAPDQLVTAMDILGPRCGAWSWEVSLGAPDLWSALR